MKKPIRVRLHKRWYKPAVLVLQLGEPCTEDILPSMQGQDHYVWRDVKVEDLNIDDLLDTLDTH